MVAFFEEDVDEIKIINFNVLYSTSDEASLQALLEAHADITEFS